MVTLHVGNSYSRVTGLPEEHFKKVRQLMSYLPNAQASYFSGRPQMPKYLMDKKGEFPTGLLYTVLRYLKENPTLRLVTNDTRVKPKSGTLFTLAVLNHIPYTDQVNAARATEAYYRGIISMPTGTGKSLVIALTIHTHQVRTLVVVPTLELKKQLTQSLRGCFPEASVGGYGCDIAIENVDGLDVKAKCDYDCVIIDEFHHAAAETYRKLNRYSWTNVFYRFGFTATPFRSQDNERLLLESVLSQVIYKLDYKTSVDKGYIVPIKAYYVDVPKKEVEGYTWGQVYSELVTNNQARNALIAQIMEPLIINEVSTLCLVKEIAHGLALQEQIGLDVQFIKGENEDNREKILEFNLEERKVLIGTTGVVGEGVDTKPCEVVVIAGLGKSKNAFMQQCGRAVRRHGGKVHATVIIFRDPSHKWTLAHFKTQCKILLEEYGVKPIKLEIPS